MASAPIIELRISGRRAMPESSTPAWKEASASSRSSSLERAG